MRDKRETLTSLLLNLMEQKKERQVKDFFAKLYFLLKRLNQESKGACVILFEMHGMASQQEVCLVKNKNCSLLNKFNPSKLFAPTAA